MTAVIIAIHVIVCILLIIMILIQRGRGGGLVEAFSDVESMFGTKTNVFLTKTTTILSIIFFLTCLSLALFSAKANRSLLDNAKTKPVQATKPLDGKQQQPVAVAPTTDVSKSAAATTQDTKQLPTSK